MNDARNQHPAGRVAEAMTRIYAAGLTTTSGGNISVRDAKDNIWITPKAVDKGRLTTGDIVFVARDGKVTGRHEPSSEFPLHRAVYDQCPELNAIVHAHPAALVACSIVQGLPPMNVIPRANQICAGVGFAPYAMMGSEKLGENIAAEFIKGRQAVIMENHGTVVGGRDLDDAFTRFEVFEAVAQTVVHASAVGRPRELSEDEIQHYESQIPGELPESGQVPVNQNDTGLRQTLAELVSRAYSQGMLISSFGNFSARLDDDDFLITPRDVNCRNTAPGNIVRVRGGHGESGKLPSRSVAIHRAIYRANPDIHTVLSTRPSHLLAFAVAGVKPDVRTIPESWLFLQDMPLVDFSMPYGDTENFARMFGPGSPAVLVANDAVYVTGGEPLETFDRLEVAEFTARSLIMSRSLGELSPISERQVEDLRKKFF
jgi:L-fuculose-phosphate aldolase